MNERIHELHNMLPEARDEKIKKMEICCFCKGILPQGRKMFCKKCWEN